MSTRLSIQWGLALQRLIHEADRLCVSSAEKRPRGGLSLPSYVYVTWCWIYEGNILLSYLLQPVTNFQIAASEDSTPLKPAAGHNRAGCIQFSSTHPPYTRTVEVAQNVLQHFTYLIESKRKYLKFFLWLILNVPIATAAILLQHNAQPHTFEKAESKHSIRMNSSYPHTRYTSHNLPPQFFASLEPSKMPPVEKGLGLMTKLMKKWKSACDCKNQTGTRMILSLAGPMLLMWVEIVWKNEGCNTSRPPLWSSGQSFWLQIQRSRVRFPALPDFSE